MRRRKQFTLAAIPIALLAVIVVLFFKSQQPSLGTQIKELYLKAEEVGDIRQHNDFVHQLGYDHAKENPHRTTKQLLQDCGDPNLFFGGCLHGAVMAQSEKLPAKELIASCLDVATTDLDVGRNCMHGVGHGLYSGSLKNGLKLCDEQVASLVEDCYSGVMMEAMLGTHHQAHHDMHYAIRPQPLRCSELKIKYTVACAAANGSYLLYYPETDVHEVGKLCASYESNLAKACITAAVDRLKRSNVTLDIDTFCDSVTKSGQHC